MAGPDARQASFSPYLEASRAGARNLVDALAGRFDYVSLLGEDSRGVFARVAPGMNEYRESDWGARGWVIRVQHAGRVAERSFSTLDDPRALADDSAGLLESLLAEGADFEYPPLPDSPLKLSWRSAFAEDPLAADPAALLDALAGARAAIQSAGAEIVYAHAHAEFVASSKLFVSKARELDQALVLGNAYAIAMARRGEISTYWYESTSGLSGAEQLVRLSVLGRKAGAAAIELLDAGKPEPGLTDVILAPDVAGLLAHEAFGHGVETDMLAMGRAKAALYLGKPVASPVVTMYDGAAGAAQTGSYAFDDEGNPASRTAVIEGGVLRAGISDALSAAEMGMPLTGNGRRQDCSRKAYARMTNTYFAPGTDSLEDMIASVESGYLLERFSSGMEDPKNWGLQGIVIMGREIKAGRLTGRVVSPVVISGYVPDVLSAVSMASTEIELYGNGFCGKGHKEYVRTSMGGPYLKTRLRVG